MGYAPRVLLAGGLGFAASFLVACGGGSGLLSSDQANTLNNQLDQAANAIGSGQCSAASAELTSFSSAVANLPPSVSPTLRNNLKQGASTVQQLAARDCHQISSSTTTSTTTSTSPTSTPSTATTTTTTPTTTTTSTTTPTVTTTPTATTTTAPGTTTTTPSASGGAGLGGGSGAGRTGGNGNAQ